MSVEGITGMKAVPPHLCTSIALSTCSLFVTLYHFWDSKSFHVACQAVLKLQFFYVDFNGFLFGLANAF